jgi:hypothetical protein
MVLTAHVSMGRSEKINGPMSAPARCALTPEDPNAGEFEPGRKNLAEQLHDSPHIGFRKGCRRIG